MLYILKIRLETYIFKLNSLKSATKAINLASFKEIQWQIIIPSPTKLRWDIVTLPSVLPSFRNILVNTLESTAFNGCWPNLVHTQSLRESGTLLIFNVKGQGHRVKLLGEGIRHALRYSCFSMKCGSLP